MTARLVSVFVVASLVLWTASVSARQARHVSLEEYTEALASLQTEVAQLDEHTPDNVTSVLAHCPATWVVATPDRTYDVEGAWLHQALTEWRRHPTAEARAEIASGLELRRRAATASLSPATDNRARDALTHILAAREFADVHGPTWLDQLRARIVEYLIDLLDRVFGSSAVPTLTRMFVWLLVGAAVVAVGLALFRAVRSSAAAEVVNEPRVSPAARPWQAWRAEAEAAAADGRWRDAVHLAYWCGVAFLEEQGAWRPDRARTPREYVSLLPEHQPANLALGALTSLLERVWYGAQPADANDFGHALASLEQLGCPSR
jgi:hypothetical protein